MTPLEIKGDWSNQGSLKQKGAARTDANLHQSESRQEELVGRIQKRTGDTLEEVESTIKACRAALSALFPVN